MNAVVSKEFYKSRFVETRKSVYTIMLDLADRSDPDLFWDINLRFDVAKEVEVEVRTQVSFFKAVFQTIKRKETLESTRIEKLDWNTIFNHISKC